MKKDETKNIIPVERIETSIYVIRGVKVMLDRDLALLYGIDTKALNRSVSRNIDRFPTDFAFKLTDDEWQNLRYQIGTSSLDSSGAQIVTLKNHGGRRYLPYAFTEQGVAMLSSVLRSPQAVKVNIEIMRAFIKMRQFLGTQKKFTKELEQLKEFVLKKSQATDQELRKVWRAIEKLSNPPIKEKRRIGFDTGLN